MVTQTTHNKQKEYIFAVGRRKEAVARIRLYKGKGENVVNSQPAHLYFPGALNAARLEIPFKTSNADGKYWFSAKVESGGKQAQLEAVNLGISRSLAQTDGESLRPLLKKRGLLTRDPRMRERRKVDTGGKARRHRKHPKR